MPKRKQQHQQDAAAASSGSGSGKARKASKPDLKPITLPSLFTLPEEIRSMILSLVCAKEANAGSPIRSSNGNKWKVDLDLNMLRSLVLVSKQVHDYFNPLLYAHVRIDTPSALRQFDAALSSRPSLALLVKSLHLGPLKDLHEKFWPIRRKGEEEFPFTGDEPVLFFRTGLTTRDEKLRPKEYRADKEFNYAESKEWACQVIRQAFDEIEVWPYLPECWFEDPNGNSLGIVEWTKRMFWVQGIFDLYLAKARELDDAADRSGAKTVELPELVLEGFISSEGPSAAIESAGAPKQEGKESDVFVVTPEQIEDHWMRPGCHVDHFDHPLFFAEPGLCYLARNVHEEVVVNPGRIEEDAYLTNGSDEEQPSPGSGDEAQDASSSSNYEAIKDDKHSDSGSSSRSSSNSGAQMKTSPASPSGRLTRDHLLKLGNSVLGHTTNVKNLSLTGIFHHCLNENAGLAQLRYLSIGPLTPPEDAATCIDEGKTTLPALEKLRVCGHHPGVGAAGLIGGNVEGLPSLQEAVWDFGHIKSDEAGGPGFLWKMVNIMRGAKGTTQAPPLKEQQASCRQIEFRAHPTYVNALLDMPSTLEIRAALADGTLASDARHSLRIMKSRASKTEDPEVWWPPPQQFDVLRREGQEWWKECALELERS